MLRDFERYIEAQIQQRGVLAVVAAPLVVAGLLSGVGLLTSTGPVLVIVQAIAVVIVAVVLVLLAHSNKILHAEVIDKGATGIRFAKRITEAGLDYEIVDWYEREELYADRIVTTRRVHLRATTANPVVLCWQRQLGPLWKNALTEGERAAVQFEVFGGDVANGVYTEGGNLRKLVDWQGKDAIVYVDLGANLTTPDERVLTFRTTWPTFSDPVLDAGDFQREWIWRRNVERFHFELHISGSCAAAGKTYRATPNAVTFSRDPGSQTLILALDLTNPPPNHELVVSPV